MSENLSAQHTPPLPPQAGNGRGTFIEIMDTTLRDGEQTSGVSFVPHEKLMVAQKLLRDVNVDRLEVASARVSEGEKDAVTMICQFAQREGRLDSIEVLGFVDEGRSVQWIASCGGRVINLLCKGSLKHCTQQLKKTPEQHFADILREVRCAHEHGLTVNVYLEDWSNGMKDSPEYVFQMLDTLSAATPPGTTAAEQKSTNGTGSTGAKPQSLIRRFMLPDTLGILDPVLTANYISQIVSRYPNQHFDFHAHNDYDLAVANAHAAVSSGVRGLHVTVNGLGERCGNAPLASIQVILKDKIGAATNIREEKLNEISRLVESYSGIAIPPNRPVTGESVFTQVAGVHADGDNKGGLYINALHPERFGRRREYALGKNSGKANILKNLEELGLALTPEQTLKVTKRITELGDKKELVTQEDLPYIVSDVLKHDTPEEHVKLLSYMVSTAYGLKPVAAVKLEVDGQVYEEQRAGDGQYDAFVRCIRHIYKDKLGRKFPWLANYTVSIPPGGRTDALVQTVITWEFEGGAKIVRTRGLDADQTEAAIKATIKMLNILE